MTLDDVLKKEGRSINDIKKIYHGKDRWCRCGCGGNYFRPGEAGFTRAINAMNKINFSEETIECDDIYTNLPITT